MLGEAKAPSRRWVRLSIAGIVLVVVVCAVALTSNSADAVGEKNMIVGTDSNRGVESSSVVMGETHGRDFDEFDDEEETDVMTDDENGDDEDDDEEDAMDREEEDVVEPTAELAAEGEYLPKKVMLCNKVCKAHFSGIRLFLCKKTCKKDVGDFSSPQKCYKDCKKACKKLAPKGKKKMCKKNCLLKFCPRPVKFCLNMCQKVGMKYFKRPKGKNIGKCKRACIKNKKVRSRPKKCKKKCKKMCKKLVKKGKGRRNACKKECKVLCPKI